MLVVSKLEIYLYKYLKAQQLYSKELKGGALIYFIYCPVEIYILIQSLFPTSNKTFSNRNCFSYYYVIIVHIMNTRRLIL